MERLYQKACYEHGCKKAKVFAKSCGELKKKLGNADLYILFTNTVSHKMVLYTLEEAKKCSACVERRHSRRVYSTMYKNGSGILKLAVAA